MTTKKIEFEFDDESSKNSISFEYDDLVDEILTTSINNDIVTIYGNREAFMLLAETFAKLALCDYKKGFHLHIKEDFDGDKSDIIEITLVE